MPFHFHLHLSWSTPQPVEQAAHEWIIQDIYMALDSVLAIYLLVEARYGELKPSDCPYDFNSVASLFVVEYMASMALYIRWRWVRNLGAMPKSTACMLVNSPAAAMIIVYTTFLWGRFFGDPQFAACLSWVLAVALIIFLRGCISIDRALSKNSSLPHLEEEDKCKNDGCYIF
ncbi:hypothetical protein VPH35_054306 [Triticum aestivum]